jgi:hypothetical protein
MPFDFSCFISYRREKLRINFIEEFCEYLNTKAKDATNIDKLFTDFNEIKNGQPFSQTIFSSIIKSYVFIVFNTQHYINEHDNWCAKELFFALKVEQKRRELMMLEDEKSFNCILILLLNGSCKDLPRSIAERNAHSLKEFDYFGKFLKNRKSKKLLDDLGDRIDDIFKVYQKYSTLNFTEQCEKIPFPSDEELLSWIKEQKAEIALLESKHLPMLV